MRLIQHKPGSGQGFLQHAGHTLVEMAVAGGILMIALVSVFAMVRKGQELISIDKHFREARGAIVRTFENSLYQPENYSNISTGTTSQDVLIDGKKSLHGTIAISIGSEQPSINGVSLPFREIQASVSWTEMAGTGTYTETVRVKKWIANVQRQ